jgi:hypothetical protein
VVGIATGDVFEVDDTDLDMPMLTCGLRAFGAAAALLATGAALATLVLHLTGKL